MASGQGGGIVRELRRVMLREGEAPDGQLLGQFVERRDEAAFEALVRRHGPMVWGVCQRALGHRQDAEDAFQATFLVLARKAGSVRPRERVGNWLYGVACNTAARARAAAGRRRARERQGADMPEPEARRCAADDLHELLDEELSRLPDQYRAPIVLCDLGGRTRKEAARQLGWPEGTVSSRLSKARALLAKRLAERGVTAPAGALLALAPGAPMPLVAPTVKAALLFGAGGAARGALSASVLALAEGVVKAMLLTKLKAVPAALLLVAGLVGLGLGGYSAIARGQPIPARPAPATGGAGPAVEPESGMHKSSELPKGTAPEQALASLDGKKQLVVRGMLRSKAPAAPGGGAGEGTGGSGAGGPGGEAGPPRVVRLETKTFRPEAVTFYDMKGRKIKAEQALKKLTKDQAVVLISYETVDKLHLRLYKEGTLLIVLPTP